MSTNNNVQAARMALAIRLTKLAERTHLRPLSSIEIMHRHLDAARDEIRALRDNGGAR